MIFMGDMLLVDVHAHLDIDGYELYGGVDKLLEECASNGVKAIVANGVTIDSNRKTLEISSKHPLVKVAMGIYPTHCLEMMQEGKAEEFDKELDFIEDMIKARKCVAIGEVGLEYKEIPDIDDTKKDLQKDCLRRFEHPSPSIIVQ